MSRERENARFITPWPNVENFPARENVLQIETQKERVYASFLSRDLQNNFESWKIFYFGLGVMKCCVFSLEWHTAFYLLVEVFIDAAVYDGNNNIGFAQYIFFHTSFLFIAKDGGATGRSVTSRNKNMYFIRKVSKESLYSFSNFHSLLCLI